MIYKQYQGAVMAEHIDINANIELIVSDDKVRAFAIIRNQQGIVPNLRHLVISATGIAEQYVRNFDPELNDLRTSSNPNRFPGEFLFAEGISPKPGRNSRITYLVKRGEGAGKVDDQGNIDFRERDLYQEVEAETAIMEVELPTRGEAGYDIYGNKIDAPDGTVENHYKPGEGVRMADEPGKHVYYATTKGVVIWGTGEVSVKQLLEINSDVDYSTGNLRYDGAITVHGSVKDGFKVLATGDVVIDGYVEKGALVTGENVIVKQGTYGEVFARNTARISFAENAIVRSKQSIEAGTINRTRILAPQLKIHKASASTLVAYDRIEAREVISPQSSPTQLTITYDPYITEVINQWRAQYSLECFCMDLEQTYIVNLGANFKEFSRKGTIPSDAGAELKGHMQKYLEHQEISQRFYKAINELTTRATGRVEIMQKIDAYTLITLYGRELQLFSARKQTSYEYSLETHDVVERSS